MKSWPLKASHFDEELAAGLMLTLFAEEPDSANISFNKDLVKAHSDISKISPILFVAEHASLIEAQGLLTRRPRSTAWT